MHAWWVGLMHSSSIVPPHACDSVLVHAVVSATPCIEAASWLIFSHIVLTQAQGGEFPVVVIPLHMSFGPMLLTRTLLYTALTRAKQLVIVVGNQAALNKCLKTNSSKNRQSLLTDRIKAGAGVAGVMPVAPVVFKGVDSQYADATDHL